MIMTDKNNLILANKLKELRKNFCMTQDDVAEVLCMSRTSFSKYENGAANPPLAVLRKLAKIYNVPIEYLIHDTHTSVILNAPQSDTEPDPENLVYYFSQLTPEERRLIIKLRLMTEDKKNEIYKQVNIDKD